MILLLYIAVGNGGSSRLCGGPFHPHARNHAAAELHFQSIYARLGAERKRFGAAHSFLISEQI